MPFPLVIRTVINLLLGICRIASAGIVAISIFSQPIKAPSPILVTLSEMTILVYDLQLLKVYEPM